jgi:hypothetical protein
MHSPDQDAPTRAVPTSYATARMIAMSMMMGVAMLWIVGWVVTQGGQSPRSPTTALTPRLATYIWAALAVGTFAIALMMRSRAVAIAEEARREGGVSGAAARAGEVQASLIAAWALIEAPALFAGVMFLLLGAPMLLMYAAPIYLLGVALTFPRAEWFGADAASRQV